MSAESWSNLISSAAFIARLRNGKYVLLFSKQAVARQWLSSGHMVTPADVSATIDDIFYVVYAELASRAV
jgi:hypothetical protein